MTAGRSHPEPENLYAGQGAVLLDIGGDVGALVVSMPRTMLGLEVEVRPLKTPVGAGEHLAHVAVVERPTPQDTVPSLVFGELVEGAYELVEKGGGPVWVTADVRGGEVTEVVWPEPA
jgi:hypothetical protein